MMGFEDALVSRKIVSQNESEVCIPEIWDLKHPNCPFVAYHHVYHEKPQAMIDRLTEKTSHKEPE